MSCSRVATGPQIAYADGGRWAPESEQLLFLRRPPDNVDGLDAAMLGQRDDLHSGNKHHRMPEGVLQGMATDVMNMCTQMRHELGRRCLLCLRELSVLNVIEGSFSTQSLTCSQSAIVRFEQQLWALLCWLTSCPRLLPAAVCRKYVPGGTATRSNIPVTVSEFSCKVSQYRHRAAFSLRMRPALRQDRVGTTSDAHR